MSPEEAIGEVPFGPSSILRGKVDCRDIFFFFFFFFFSIFTYLQRRLKFNL